MPRTSNARILEWGTPPEPEPTGWEAVRIALVSKPGEWANVGEFTASSARKIASEKVPAADGFETRTAVSAKHAPRVDLWVRYVAPATEPVGAGAPSEEDSSSAPPAADAPSKPARARRA